MNYKELLKIDEGNPEKLGGFNSSEAQDNYCHRIYFLHSENLYKNSCFRQLFVYIYVSEESQ